MKRYFPILLGFLIGFCYSFTADAQGISKAGKKVSFTFPDSLSASKTILFPTYEAISEDYAATVAVDVEEFYTFLTLGTLTGNLTLNLTVADHVSAGALLYVKTLTDDNRVITWGTDIDGAAFTTDSVKYELNTFIYNGTAFQKVAAAKIN